MRLKQKSADAAYSEINQLKSFNEQVEGPTDEKQKDLQKPNIVAS